MSQLIAGNNADAGQALYDDAYSNVPVIGGKQMSNNMDRSAIICEAIVEVGLSKSKLAGDLFEMRGYMRGRLGL